MEPNTQPSKFNSIVKYLIVFIGGVLLTLSAAYFLYMREIGIKNQELSARLVSSISALPVCQNEIKISRDEAGHITAMVMYDEWQAKELRRILPKVTSPEVKNILTSEIYRSDSEIKTLKNLYQDIYRSQYVASTTVTLDLVGMYTAASSSTDTKIYLNLLRGSLEQATREIYSYVLTSNNRDLQKIANDFTDYKVKTIQAIEKVK